MSNDEELDFESDDVPPNCADRRDTHLNTIRIRQLATVKRTAYRTRSYCIIAAAVAVVAVIQLVVMTIQHLSRPGFGLRPIAYILTAVCFSFATSFFVRKAIALTREASRSALTDPETPPDFSTLSDGSHRVKALEEIT